MKGELRYWTMSIYEEVAKKNERRGAGKMTE